MGKLVKTCSISQISYHYRKYEQKLLRMSQKYNEIIEDNNNLAENGDTKDVTTNNIIERVRCIKPNDICVVLANRVEDLEFVNLSFVELKQAVETNNTPVWIAGFGTYYPDKNG